MSKRISLRHFIFIAAIAAFALAAWSFSTLQRSEDFKASEKDAALRSSAPTNSKKTDRALKPATSIKGTTTIGASGATSQVQTSSLVNGSFDVAEDLFAYAVASANSADPAVLGHGLIATMNCIAVKQQLELILQLAANTTTDAGNQAARRDSAKILINRCKGFLENENSANAGLRSRIAQSSRATSAYVTGASEGEPTGQQLRNIIEREDFLAFEKVMTDLLEGTLSANAVPDNAASIRNFSLAYSLAICDLGRDCSKDSMTYAIFCAMESRCDGSLEKVFTEGIPQADLMEIALFRERIFKAYVAKSFAFFGL